MGWRTSISEYRDAYRQLQAALNIQPGSFYTAYTTSPTADAVNARSRMFENLGTTGTKTNRERMDSVQKELQEKMPIAASDDTANLFFCYPASVPADVVVHYVESMWQATSPYSPFDNFVVTRCLDVVCGWRRRREGMTGSAAAERHEGVLHRWDFRLWMLMSCEFYHVLAILSESKSLPSNAQKWISRVSKTDKDAEGRQLFSAEVDEVADIDLTVKHIKKNFLTMAKSEMPGAFKAIAGLGSESDLNPTADAIMEEARNYYVCESHTTTGKNPLRTDGATGKKSMDDLKPDTVPVLVFVEWLALRAALFYKSMEDDQKSYVPETVAKRKRELVIPVMAAAAEVSEVTLTPLEAWRAALTEYRETHPKHPPTAGLTEEEQARMDAARHEMDRLFRALSNNSGAISQGEASSNSYVAFGLDDATLLRKTHARLSDGSFCRAVDGRGEHITNIPYLAVYLRAYFALFDMHKEAAAMEEGDRPGGKKLRLSAERRELLQALLRAIADGDIAFLSNLSDIDQSSEEELVDLLRFVLTLPLQDAQERRYALFFLFSHNNRYVLLSQTAATVRGEGCAWDSFTHGLYTQYLRYTLLGRVFPDLTAFQTLCRQAMQYVVHRRENRDDGMDGDKLYSKQYGALLEYVAGCTVATLLHRRTRTEESDTISAAFFPELCAFIEEERHARKRATAGPQPDSTAFAEGTPALAAAQRYAEFRTSTRVSDSDDILSLAELPYSGSAAHAAAREELWRALWSDSGDEADLDTLSHVGDSDGSMGYAPTRALVSLWKTRLELDKLPQCVLSPGAKSPDDLVRKCVAQVNSVVGRPDEGGEEVHRRDLRFVFEFVSLLVSLDAEIREAVRETVGIIRAQSSGWEVQSSTDIRCDYSTKNFPKFFLVRIRRLCVNTVALSLANNELLKLSKNSRACVEPVRLAWRVAAVLVQYSNFMYEIARERYMEMIEINNEALLQEKKFFKPKTAAPTSTASAPVPSPRTASQRLSLSREESKMVTYWERLRFILPFGNSTRQRERRRDMYEEMDILKRGYLVLSDVFHGLVEGAHLSLFRKDISPVLYRALRATKGVQPNKKEGSLYITTKKEYVVFKREFKAFMFYMYRYMEIFYMFDVLTCCGRITAKLSVRPGDEVCIVSEEEAAQRLASVAVSLASSHGASPDGGAVASTGSPSAEVTMELLPSTVASSELLVSASQLPFEITTQSVNVVKEVSPAQFAAATPLLRRWGVCPNRVPAPDTADGVLRLNGFITWASKHRLRPEGYGHGYNETDARLINLEDAIIQCEEEFTAESA